MRKNQYTPGKWSIAYDIPGSIIDAEGDTVARVVQYASTPYEVKAHAHLIAAAPELLEALEDIINQWPYIACAHGPNHPRIPGHQVEKARAAIAKARGLR